MYMAVAHDLQRITRYVLQFINTKLSASDLIEIKAKYIPLYNCFTAKKNDYKSFICLLHSGVKCEAAFDCMELLLSFFVNDEHILIT